MRKVKNAGGKAGKKNKGREGGMGSIEKQRKTQKATANVIQKGKESAQFVRGKRSTEEGSNRERTTLPQASER